MAEITVKTEPNYEMHSTLEDQQTQQEESKDTTSFCYETVTKEEVILEDEFVPPEEAFATPRETKSHLERAHEKHAQQSSEVSVLEEDGVFICSECNKSFGERHLCQQHISKHLSLTKERTVCCPKCPKKFLSEKHLAKHEAWHEASIKKQSEVIKCDECNITFKTKRMLTRHLNRHEAMKEGKYQCKICSMRHASDYELKIHTKRHEINVEMPSVPPPVIIVRNDHSAFQCPECSMVFTVRRAYKTHAQKHINIRNGMYKCDICEKICGSSHNLDTHMRRHRNGEIKEVTQPRELSYECSKCDKKFGRQLLLSKHFKIHEAIEKGLYKCKLCGKYLGSPRSLARHEQRHDANKKARNAHKCTECDRAYIRKYSFICHVKAKHGGNEPNQRENVKMEEC